MLAAIAFCVSAATAAHAQKPLHSTVFRPDSARSTKTGATSIVRSLVDTVTSTYAKLEMHETTVPPGKAAHAAHTHPHEELVLVRSGTIEVSFNGVKHLAGPGSVVFMASNELHGISNPGPEPLTYLIITIYPHDLASRAAAP